MAIPGYRALLIGNSTFPDDSHNLQSLEGPVNDVALLRDALADPEVGLFEPHRVRMVPERTAPEIMMELEKFFASATRADQLLLYYSGHGLLSVTGQLFLCARDTRTDLLQSTAVSSSAINAMIDASAATTTIIVLDCCHSGAFKGGGLPDALRGSGRFLLTSCRTRELANDANQANHASVFTHHLVNGLRGAAPDYNANGYIDLNELYEYVHERLASEGKQIPQRSFSGGGDVEIARRRDKAAPALTLERPTPEGPVLDLSETVLNLPDVRPDDALPPERVYVRNRTKGPFDWSVETTAGWVDLDHQNEFFTIALHPQPGMNRANIVVREQSTGETKTVRVSVRVVKDEIDLRPVVPEHDAPHFDLKGFVQKQRTPMALAGVLAGALVLAFLLRPRVDTTPPDPGPTNPEVTAGTTNPVVTAGTATPGVTTGTSTPSVTAGTTPGTITPRATTPSVTAGTSTPGFTASTGTPRVAIPHVYGLPRAEGEAQLRSAGFVVHSITVCSGSVGAGQIRQVRAGTDTGTILDDKDGVTSAGQAVAKGSAVTVKVGSGAPCS